MLSHDWTLASARGVLRILARSLGADSILDTELNDFIHLAICDLAELLNAAKYPDYGVPVVINTVSPGGIVTGATYTSSTNNIQQTSHGFTSADIGKLIAFQYSTTFQAVAKIVSITDANNFIVSNGFGSSTYTINYCTFTASQSITIDISSYRLDTITKVVDSINGLVVPADDNDIENYSTMDQKQYNVFWDRIGDTLYLYKGTHVASLGTLTLFYNRLPIKATLSTDYLDIRDKYMKLALDKAKILVYETLKQQPPENLTSTTNTSVAAIRQGIQDEARAAQSNSSKIK
jgi:hypothetical protein